MSKVSTPLAIVDHQDPSGTGMFSKLGRQTSKANAIFKKKTELFVHKSANRKIRNFDTSKIKDFWDKMYEPVEIDQVEELRMIEDEKKNQRIEKLKKLVEASNRKGYIFKQPGRDPLNYDGKKIKTTSKPSEIYLKYDFKK